MNPAVVAMMNGDHWIAEYIVRTALSQSNISTVGAKTPASTNARPTRSANEFKFR